MVRGTIEMTEIIWLWMNNISPNVNEPIYLRNDRWRSRWALLTYWLEEQLK